MFSVLFTFFFFESADWNVLCGENINNLNVNVLIVVPSAVYFALVCWRSSIGVTVCEADCVEMRDGPRMQALAYSERALFQMVRNTNRSGDVQDRTKSNLNWDN